MASATLAEPLSDPGTVMVGALFTAATATVTLSRSVRAPIPCAPLALPSSKL